MIKKEYLPLYEKDQEPETEQRSQPGKNIGFKSVRVHFSYLRMWVQK